MSNVCDIVDGMWDNHSTMAARDAGDRLGLGAETLIDGTAAELDIDRVDSRVQFSKYEDEAHAAWEAY